VHTYINNTERRKDERHHHTLPVLIQIALYRPTYSMDRKKKFKLYHGLVYRFPSPSTVKQACRNTLYQLPPLKWQIHQRHYYHYDGEGMMKRYYDKLGSSAFPRCRCKSAGPKQETHNTDRRNAGRTSDSSRPNRAGCGERNVLENHQNHSKTQRSWIMV